MPQSMETYSAAFMFGKIILQKLTLEQMDRREDSHL